MEICHMDKNLQHIQNELFINAICPMCQLNLTALMYLLLSHYYDLSHLKTSSLVCLGGVTESGINCLFPFLFFFLITARVSAEGCVQGLPVKLNKRLMRLVAAQLITNAYASRQSKFSAHTKKRELHTTSVSFFPLAELLPSLSLLH